MGILINMIKDKKIINDIVNMEVCIYASVRFNNDKLLKLISIMDFITPNRYKLPFNKNRNFYYFDKELNWWVNSKEKPTFLKYITLEMIESGLY